MRRVKLAHLQLLPLLSGVQNVMLKMLANLDNEKYEFYVISKPGGPLVDKVLELGYHHIPIPSLRRDLSLLDGIAFLHLFWVFRKYKFDIVHTHSSKTGFLGRIAARFAGIKKIVHTVHGFPFHAAQQIPIRISYQILEKFAASFCSKLIFVNDFEREFAIKYKIVKEDKAVTIYNGIEFNSKKIKSDQLIKKDQFTIGSVLRFEKIKNIEITIQTAIQVCRQNEKIKFYFIGDGSLLTACRTLVSDAGLEDKIILPGWQNNTSDWLKTFDAFLLFSISEGLSISILEAMSIGLPIIASDVKGNNELVSFRNGITVPINGIDRLAEVLLSLPTREEEMKNWGDESIAIVKEKFNMKTFISKYESIYES
ncbi:glycosyltransferase family 4 protein [Candidatus Cloacimonadota bacterium]